MQNRRNLYRILHVQPDAPAPVIKASYRTIMQTLRQHPDLGGEAEAAQMLNEAVAILCDPSKRALYDRERLQAENRKQDAAAPAEFAAPLVPLPQSGKHMDNISTSCLFCEAPLPAADRLAAVPYVDEHLCPRCGGARSLATVLTDTASSTTRNEHRTALSAIATLWPHWPLFEPLGVRILDVSAKGAALVCSGGVTTTSMVLLKSPMLNAIGQIRYCHPMGNGWQNRIGVSFKTLRMSSSPGELLTLQV